MLYRNKALSFVVTLICETCKSKGGGMICGRSAISMLFACILLAAPLASSNRVKPSRSESTRWLECTRCTGSFGRNCPACLMGRRTRGLLRGGAGKRAFSKRSTPRSTKILASAPPSCPIDSSLVQFLSRSRAVLAHAHRCAVDWARAVCNQVAIGAPRLFWCFDCTSQSHLRAPGQTRY